MTTETNLDMNRLPHEIRRALDKEMVLIEGVTPGLRMRPDPETGRVEVLQDDGLHLGWVPTYRLRSPSLDLLWQGAAVALDQFPEVLKDEIAAALAAGAVELEDPPDSDRVRLVVIVADGTRYLLFDAHRCVVVEGWPQDDAPDDVDGPDA